MKVVAGAPPIFERVRAMFGSGVGSAWFAWGDKIYSPSGVTPPPDIRAHEEVHQRQQAAVGGPEVWWEKWLADPRFRLDQEARGYARQYAFICQHVRNRSAQRRILHRIAAILAGPTYGHVIDEAGARTLLLRLR